MKHHKVDYNTDLKVGDEVLLSRSYGQVWAEIYSITVDDGIFTSHGNICRSELEGVEAETLHYSI